MVWKLCNMLYRNIVSKENAIVKFAANKNSCKSPIVRKRMHRRMLLYGGHGCDAFEKICCLIFKNITRPHCELFR